MQLVRLPELKPGLPSGRAGDRGDEVIARSNPRRSSNATDDRGVLMCIPGGQRRASPT